MQGREWRRLAFLKRQPGRPQAPQMERFVAGLAAQACARTYRLPRMQLHGRAFRSDGKVLEYVLL